MKSMIAQLRFALFPVLALLALQMTVWGGPWAWAAGVMLLAVNLVGDELTDLYLETVNKPRRALLDALLYSVPILAVAMTFIMLMQTANPGTVMARLASASGFGAPAQAGWLSFLGVVFTTGILTGHSAVAYGHELIHRPNRLAWLIGQALCARCLHPSVAIEHVYGHHLNVGTPVDASTAPRGMGFWRFVLRALIWENKGAVAIEAKRLGRKGLPFLSVGNRVLQGFAILSAMLLAVVLSSGWQGTVAFLASGIMGLAFFILGNYISHYGLVRAPEMPILPRHSWNSPRFFSTSTLLNIPRHSHHHASGSAPYWELAPMEKAPVHPHGWAWMSIAALMPPVWFRIMQRQLNEWDRDMASPEELKLLGASRGKPDNSNIPSAA